MKEPYVFTGIDVLVGDFFVEVERRRAKREQPRFKSVKMMRASFARRRRRLLRLGRPVPRRLTYSPSHLRLSCFRCCRRSLIERLQGLGAVSLRGLARALGRDVKRDVRILLDWGLVEWTAERKLVVPYDVIHADFDLRAVE